MNFLSHRGGKLPIRVYAATETPVHDLELATKKYVDDNAGGGGGTPGGSNTQVQYNDSGSFGGMAGVTWDDVGNELLLTAQAATATPITIRAAASQTDNLTEWKNSSGTVGARITAALDFSNNPTGITATEIFGDGATATSNYCTVLGNGASATNQKSTSIGESSSTTGNDATAIGADSVCGTLGVVIGKGANNTVGSGVALGASASAGSNGIAIGRNVTVGTNGVGVGRSVTATGSSSTGVGYSATSSATDSSAFGHTATASAVGTTSIGRASTASATRATALGRSSNAGHQQAVCIGYGSASTANYQFVCGSPTGTIQDVYFGKGVTDASPTNYTINGTGGSGTNIAGGKIIIAGGKATGNAAGGEIEFQTSDAGASGSALQSLTTKVKIDVNGGIQPASMADSQANNNTIYYSTTQSKLVYKDSGGTVNNLY